MGKPQVDFRGEPASCLARSGRWGYPQLPARITWSVGPRLLFSLVTLSMLSGCFAKSPETTSDISQRRSGHGEGAAAKASDEPHGDTDSELGGPLAMTGDDLKAKLSPHDQAATDAINKLTIGETTKALGYINAILVGDSSVDGDSLMLDQIGFDRYENVSDWTAQIPDFSQRLWNSDWDNQLPEGPNYVIRLRLRQSTGASRQEKTRAPVMSNVAEAFLLKLQSHCFSEQPDPYEHDIWISHATMTGRAFADQGDDEYYLFEMLWHHRDE